MNCSRESGISEVMKKIEQELKKIGNKNKPLTRYE